MQSRRTSTALAKCNDCGWSGQEKELEHTYRPIQPGDVEPYSLCPKCGSEDIDIEEEL